MRRGVGAETGGRSMAVCTGSEGEERVRFWIQSPGRTHSIC